MGLTDGQKKALNIALSGKNLFLTGGGGVGKTYIVKKIVSDLEKAGKSVLVTASTGKAAELIGGVTCHRAFSIPISMAWKTKPNFSHNAPICAADVILIDEVSMLRIDSFEFIIRSISKANAYRFENEKKGIQLIVCGDFFQLPPVLPDRSSNGNLSEKEVLIEHYQERNIKISSGYAFESPYWNKMDFVVCTLTEVLRQEDKEMISALNRLRFGNAAALSYFSQNSRKRKFPKNSGEIKLCGKNKTAESISNTALAALPGKVKTYHAEIYGTISDQDKGAPDILKLKVGAQVLMLQNSTDELYVNGSTGIVKALYDDSIDVMIHGETVNISYYEWNVESYQKNAAGEIEKVLIGSFRQLPVRLGYAITIHKSQGQSYEKVEFHPEIFAYGQLYVGLSRVHDIKNLYISGHLNTDCPLADPVVVAFYKSLGITEPPEPPKTQQPKKRKKENAAVSTPRKAKMSEHVSPPQENTVPQPIIPDGYTEILYATGLQQTVWTYAHTLDKTAKMADSRIYVSDKYSRHVQTFADSLSHI